MGHESATPRRPGPGNRRRVVGDDAAARGARRVRLSPLSLSVVTGVLALALGGVGAVSTTSAAPLPTGAAHATVSYAAGSVPPSSAVLLDRGLPVSRDTERQALGQASSTEVEPAAAAVARQRNAALQQFADKVQREANATPLNSWVLPLQNYRITARFGQGSSLWVNRHTGLDFAAPTGTILNAVTGGRVLSAGPAGAYGNRVVISSSDGTETWFCHMSAFAVKPGDEVASGQTIGKVGATGNVTGPHLHLEVRPGGGDPVDPAAALQARGVNPG